MNLLAVEYADSSTVGVAEEDVPLTEEAVASLATAVMLSLEGETMFRGMVHCPGYC